MDMAVLSGELKLPNYEQDPRRYCQIRFRPPGWSWIDPTKEVQAYKEAVKAGFMTTVPFLAAFVGVLLSGWVADLLVRKGFSLGFARKTPIICGLLISTCIMGANYTNDPMMIMCLMALAFFGNGFASITWSLVSSLAPMRLIGLTGGVFNFAGGLGGITVPLVVGYLAQGYGFAPALVYISAVALIGALSYILLVGDVKRVG